MSPTYYWPGTKIPQRRLTRFMLRVLMALDVLLYREPKRVWYSPEAQETLQRVMRLYP